MSDGVSPRYCGSNTAPRQTADLSAVSSWSHKKAGGGKRCQRRSRPGLVGQPAGRSAHFALAAAAPLRYGSVTPNSHTQASAIEFPITASPSHMDARSQNRPGPETPPGKARATCGATDRDDVSQAAAQCRPGQRDGPCPPAEGLAHGPGPGGRGLSGLPAGLARGIALGRRRPRHQAASSAHGTAWGGSGSTWGPRSSTTPSCTAFWLQHRLWGDATLGYHLVNLALHALAATGVLLVLRRLNFPGAHWRRPFLPCIRCTSSRWHGLRS